MESSQPAHNNPLGLSLDFMFGRGYLWAERQRLSDWIALESLRMEIPDLKFPFDARSGLDRFRHTRCLVREVEFAISEVGLGDLLSEAASHLDGFQDLQVRFLEDAAHISLRVRAFGVNTHISFRAALIPPEPSRADEIHLSLYDYRAYGPLPYPVRLLAYELVTSLLNTPTLRAPGRGQSFTIGIAGDILSFRPLKLLFLHIFPRVGWKLPNLSNIVLDHARIRPGVLTIRAVSHDDHLARTRPQSPGYHLAASLEGARALAAYEAKDLFAHADAALFDGQLRQALAMLAGYRDIYGLHPELVSRLLDCLMADPSPGNVAEAESICRELAADDAHDLQVLATRPLIALVSGRRAEAPPAFSKLADALRARGETGDWILCELSAAALLQADEPEAAAARLREVLKLAPRNRVALEELKELYARLGEHQGLEETLKRLTGVYTDRQTLKATYLALARHLMNRTGDLAEARMYLERVLRLDPGELEALDTLGESYVLGGEPLRALKAFGSAARAAESNGQNAIASRLHRRVAELWYRELDDASQALLSCRRALSLIGGRDPDEGGAIGGGAPDSGAERAGLLWFAAELCEARGRLEEAADYLTELVPQLERAHDQATPYPGADGPFAPIDPGGEFAGEPAGEAGGDEPGGGGAAGRERALVAAHARLARVYELRERPHAAATHWRRVLELSPEHAEAFEHLETFLRQAGRPEQLIELYGDLLRVATTDARRVALYERLAELYAGLGLVDDAQSQLRLALELAPNAERPRASLIELLRGHGRHETLRDALNTLLMRTREREVRFELLMELGSVLEFNLRQPVGAARAYIEAMQLRPQERATLDAACRALEGLVAESGPSARAPVGSQPIGQLLEHLLIRQAELAPTIAGQRDALIRLALLAEARGDQAAAAEARQRARLLAPDEDDAASDVDARLDAMLSELAGGEPPVIEESVIEEPVIEEPVIEESVIEEPVIEAPVIEEPVIEEPVIEEPVIEEPVAEAPVIEEPVANESGDEEDVGDDERGGPGLEAFRSRFQDLLRRPAGLPAPGALDPKSPLARIIGNVAAPPAAPGVVVPGVVVPGFEDAVELTVAADAADAHAGAVGDEPTGAGEDLLAQLERARDADSPEALVEAIDAVLEAPPEALSSPLSDERRVLLQRELGELLYYELEDAQAALGYLEAVHRADPTGVGGVPSVVNALESIYEDEGRVEQRIRLLETRLARAESPEMDTTYRLLLAQIVWDKQDDAPGARRWLQKVLEQDRQHESAHRLLAEIAQSEGDLERAARHLGVVLEVAGGGLDAVEVERELADLLLNRIGDPVRALPHFEGVLAAAPGDSLALEGIKQCQAASGDWAGYVASLGRELGLLVGRPNMGRDREAALGAMLELEVEAIASALRVAASQIVSDAAHIVERELGDGEAARRLWGLAYELWPEHVEALERRIELDRALGRAADLADDLEAYAAMLLDTHARFEALVESAGLRSGRLGDAEGARGLLAEALALVQDAAEPPPGVDEARRALKTLQTEHDR